MKRALVLTAVIFMGAGLAACGDDGDTDSAPTTVAAGADATTTSAPADDPAPATSEVVQVADSSLGEILVDSEGHTLYLFMNDEGSTSSCTGGCANTWPALTADGTPSGGEGLDNELLGLGTRDDGSQQVTYDGHPLYRYSSDSEPGDTNGHGVGGVWFAVAPTGQPISA